MKSGYLSPRKESCDAGPRWKILGHWLWCRGKGEGEHRLVARLLQLHGDAHFFEVLLQGEIGGEGGAGVGGRLHQSPASPAALWLPCTTLGLDAFPPSGAAAL